MTRDPNLAFELRVKLYDVTGPICSIRAYDDKPGTATHFRLDLDVRHDGIVIFPRGQLWLGIPVMHATDSDYAKSAALGCVAMKPGDTDADYFTGYTPAQLAWARAHGEELDMTRITRYGED